MIVKCPHCGGDVPFPPQVSFLDPYLAEMITMNARGRTALQIAASLSARGVKSPQGGSISSMVVAVKRLLYRAGVKRAPTTFEQKAVRNREIYALSKEKTFAEIGQQFKLSPSRVSQIVLQAEFDERRAQKIIPVGTVDDSELIENLPFSNRVMNALRYDTKTVGDLVKLTEQQLRWIPNIGDISIIEIRGVLAAYNRKLATEIRL